MDGRGGCCIARYAGAGSYDLSKVDRIMLRFRPIAPKPVAGNNSSGRSSSENCVTNASVGRTKRKYVRDGSNTSNNDKNNSKCNKRCNRRRKTSNEARGDPVVTLPLLLEAPDQKDKSSTANLTARTARNVPVWLSFENCGAVKLDPSPPENWCRLQTEQAVVTVPEQVRYVESCVTVEFVTDTWLDCNGLGCTDNERRANLSEDACPGFISDLLGRVTWINKSYRRMVSVDSDGSEDVEVCLIMKEKVAVAMRTLIPYPAFTCSVRLQYSGGKERNCLTVPCDVWRMESGGFAWRLDVKAALSLSLGR